MTSEERKRLEAYAERLPKGGLTKKTIHGKQYTYYQWYEDGRQHARIVKDEEAQYLSEQISKRKAVQAQLKEHRTDGSEAGVRNSALQADESIHLNLQAILGDDLRRFAAPVERYRKRLCYGILHDYIYRDDSERVFILYGLRRTGKTTMIRQLLNGMGGDMLQKAAFLQARSTDTLAALNQDLKTLDGRGFRYVFIDEVTQLEDFIEGAALLSDIFAARGMRIVLSGTDSLGFLFSEDEQLYDRCIFLHTTFIPYREFEQVLGVHGIDRYIEYGGTMSFGGVHYNDPDRMQGRQRSVFESARSTDEYVDSAIAHNIQHSLRNYQYGGHFRHLKDLYDHGELTSAINRVVEDMNHEFTLDVLTREFRSQDLRLSASNLRRDRTNPVDVLDRIDSRAVTDRFRQILKIRNKEEQTVVLDEVHVQEIREYLDLLDLTEKIPVVHMGDPVQHEDRVVFTQPGLRFSQARALIDALMEDEIFAGLDVENRKLVKKRILREIRGRMMEDIVLLETRTARRDRQVFKLQFPIGEFDMVSADPEKGTCEIYEVRHSHKALREQARHLCDEDKLAKTAFRYGRITGKYVIYSGEPREENGIQWLNVEQYLVGLGKSSNNYYY